jgi:hypothetical protein
MAKRVPKATRKVKARRVKTRRKRSLLLRQLQCKCPMPGRLHGHYPDLARRSRGRRHSNIGGSCWWSPTRHSRRIPNRTRGQHHQRKSAKTSRGRMGAHPVWRITRSCLDVGVVLILQAVKIHCTLPSPTTSHASPSLACLLHLPRTTPSIRSQKALSPPLHTPGVRKAAGVDRNAERRRGGTQAKSATQGHTLGVTVAC